MPELIFNYFLIFFVIPIGTYLLLGDEFVIENTVKLTEPFIKNKSVKDISKKLSLDERDFVLLLIIFYSVIMVITLGYVNGINTSVLFLIVYSRLKSDQTTSDRDLTKLLIFVFLFLIICFFENITNINYYFDIFVFIKLAIFFILSYNNFSLTISIYNKINPRNPFVELDHEDNEDNNEDEDNTDDL